ncbi:hypothetical protein R4172_01705 [Rhodococcus kroppenstedtii]|nr:hypothetical protein [Rhodococcus kroppenstedtii]MDV7196274.1 hypothetical protein [Rhodococcus kroppenstedtii]
MGGGEWGVCAGAERADDRGGIGGEVADVGAGDDAERGDVADTVHQLGLRRSRFGSLDRNGVDRSVLGLYGNGCSLVDHDLFHGDLVGDDLLCRSCGRVDVSSLCVRFRLRILSGVLGGCGVRGDGSGEGGGVGDHVDHDSCRGRRHLVRIDRRERTLRAAAVAAERGVLDQREQRIGCPRTLAAAVVLAHLRGQAFDDAGDDGGAFGGHRRPHRPHPIETDLGEEAPPLHGFLPPFADGVGVAAVDHLVAQIPHPRCRPRPRLPQCGGDVGVHQTLVRATVDEFGAGDDGADVTGRDHSVAQALEHPREPVAEGHGVVEESFGDVLRDRQGGGDAGGALGVRIDRPLVAVFLRHHQFGVEGRGVPVAAPLQIARPRGEVGQRVEVPDHRQVERRR